MNYAEERMNEVIQYVSEGFGLHWDRRGVLYIVDAPCERCEKIGWLNKSSESGWLCESCWSVAEMEL